MDPSDQETVAGPALVVVGVGALVTLVAVWGASAGLVGPDTGAAVAMTGGAVTALCALAAAAHGQLGPGSRLRALSHRASHDELTGLPNREGVQHALRASIARAYRHNRHVGVLFCDLDGFKAVNDTMGHEAGDELLRAFADRLRASVRAEDLVARLGGDEFVVVCGDLERSAEALAVARNVQKAAERPLPVGDDEVRITPSIGVATASRRRPADPDSLLGEADRAMYRAKRNRLGVCVYDDGTRREDLGALAVQRELVPALADGQFRVHYQPVVSVGERRFVSLEALIRWYHPERGIVGPEQFLAAAEETGLVARLGEVVLREALAQQSLWNHLAEEARELTISVNVAERQLVDQGLADRIDEMLSWAGIPASQLRLEVREEVLARHADDANGTLGRLARLGVGIIVDDFGTSEAALTRIGRLAVVTGLKIDRTVTAQLGRDGIAEAIVAGAVSLGRARGLDVIAAGVESLGQIELLEGLGVDLMQGFHFLRPAPGGVFDTWMSDPAGEPAVGFSGV